MTVDKQLSELVERLKAAGGSNLLSVVLHGSAAANDFHPEYSDLNVLCVVDELSPAAMRAFSPVLSWWSGFKHPAPLFFTRSELETAADVFPIEMLDIKERHRVLYGPNLFRDLHVPMALHRVQLEHELRTKLLLLRQHYLNVSGDRERAGRLMLDSVSNFLALFRHALIAMGETPSHTKNEIAHRIAAKLGADPAPFEQLLHVREKKLDPQKLDVEALFAAYLSAIEKVIQAIDAL
jgi:hypothetical protein